MKKDLTKTIGIPGAVSGKGQAQAAFKLVTIGETGTGKSRLSIDAARFGPVFVLDFDGKWTAGLDANDYPDTVVDNIVSLNLKAPKEVKKMPDGTLKPVMYTFKDVTDIIEKLEQQMLSGESPFATIVIDTFTFLNEMVLLEARAKDLKELAQKVTAKNFDIWTLAKGKLTFFYSKLYALPANIITNCHIKKGEDALGRSELGVMGEGGYRNIIRSNASDTLFLNKSNGKYIINGKGSQDQIPSNALIKAKFTDPQGNLLTNTLDCFADRAKKKGTEEELKELETILNKLHG